MIRFGIRCMLAGCLTLAACAGSRPASRPTGTVCFPPAWGGIVPGITEDRDVVTLYGPGLLSEEMGHGGGRYYTDTARTATLVVEIGVDSFIESVHVLDGLHPPEGSAPGALPVSQRFEPERGFGPGGKLRLGAGRWVVEKVLGRPTDTAGDAEPGVWTYETDYGKTDCFAYAALSIRFVRDVVAEVAFLNGE